MCSQDLNGWSFAEGKSIFSPSPSTGDTAQWHRHKSILAGAKNNFPMLRRPNWSEWTKETKRYPWKTHFTRDLLKSAQLYSGSGAVLAGHHRPSLWSLPAHSGSQATFSRSIMNSVAGCMHGLRQVDPQRIGVFLHLLFPYLNKKGFSPQPSLTVSLYSILTTPWNTELVKQFWVTLL